MSGGEAEEAAGTYDGRAIKALRHPFYRETFVPKGGWGGAEADRPVRPPRLRDAPTPQLDEDDGIGMEAEEEGQASASQDVRSQRHPYYNQTLPDDGRRSWEPRRRGTSWLEVPTHDAQGKKYSRKEREMLFEGKDLKRGSIVIVYGPGNFRNPEERYKDHQQSGTLFKLPDGRYVTGVNSPDEAPQSSKLLLEEMQKKDREWLEENDAI